MKKILLKSTYCILALAMLSITSVSVASTTNSSTEQIQTTTDTSTCPQGTDKIMSLLKSSLQIAEEIPNSTCDASKVNLNIIKNALCTCGESASCYETAMTTFSNESKAAGCNTDSSTSTSNSG